ncbi:MAG: DedA family protein [Gemmatimonadota bacterium]
MGDILGWLLEIPDWLLYLSLGLAASVENIVPPIPADVMVLAGGVVSGAGDASPVVLFVAVWVGNVGSALLVYAVGRRYGPRFFEGRMGRYLLAPRQIQALALAYRRFGFSIIFFSRFLPVFRPVVPAFAGVSRVGFWRTTIPIALASAIWYGLLVYLGAVAGSNWGSVLAFFSRTAGWLTIIAGLLLAALGWWWWRTRAPRQGTGSE